MLRFAPSPTGDMLISDLRVALLNYIVAKQRKEEFIVRIEDIEKEKNIEGKDQEILDLLALFGIEYSQVIYQSENIRFHSAMALQLIHEKKAFSCFCSWEWIESKRKEAEALNQEYMYDDACKDLPAELVIDNLNPFTIRIKKPKQSITVYDHIKGDLSFDADSLDSFMIMGQDKTPRYIFASAIDDLLSDISLVIRDEKHIKNTPKQEHIRASLEYNKKLEYAHLPTLANDLSVKSLLEEGYLPSSISNYLISMASGTPQEIFTISDAIESFDLDKMSDSIVEFDIDTLKKINQKHLFNLDAKELSRYVGFADEEIGELARLYLKDVSTTKELREKIEPIFATKEIPKELESEAKQMTQLIQSAPYFDEYKEFKSYILEKLSIDEKRFEKLFSLLLTGSENGPDIAEIYTYLKNYIGEIIK